MAAKLVVLLSSWIATANAAPTSERLPAHTEIFYNARLALRDGRASDVLKLWLLRNSVRQHLGTSQYDAKQDADFRSVVWAALGKLGLCQDGYLKDDNGAGLWPLAMHNYLVRSTGRGDPPEREPPFGAFEVGRQQRFISLLDVLALPELKSVTFTPTSCYWPQAAHYRLGGSPFDDINDRIVAARLMRQLLKASLTTVVHHKVRGTPVIEARIFDLDLALSQMERSRARRQGNEAKQQARSLGVSEAGAQEVQAQVSAWPPQSREAHFLRKSLTWSAEEWLSLSRSRRLFLFSQSRPLAKSRDQLMPLVLAIIDALISRDMGEEAGIWIAHLEAGEAPSLREIVFAGERGKRLLQLDPATGFHERASIALHRGVAFLEAGNQQDALRSFAYAMANAEKSSAATQNMNLARRWLSFVMSRYQTTEDLVATLKALVPAQEWNALAEELIWKAALRADKPSFDRAVATVRRGGALDDRIAYLRLLAEGRNKDLTQQLRVRAANEPHQALRFIGQLLNRLEAEDKEVRQAHITTLKFQIELLEQLAAESSTRRSNVKSAQEQLLRARAVLEGLGVADASATAKTSSLSVEKQTFAGNVRLAPVDPLPWPFVVPDVRSPSAFTPLTLEPVEWRDGGGKLVFGWRLSE